MRWALAAALLWAPTSSQAMIWFGLANEQVTCPGVGTDVFRDDFTLNMEPGAGWGQLTIVGGPPLDVWVDWTVDGRWSYFAASFFEPNGGPYILTGWIKGRRMRGWLVGHNYGNGCVVQAKVKGWQ